MSDYVLSPELVAKVRAGITEDLAFFQAAPDRQCLLRAPYPGEDEYFSAVASTSPQPGAVYAVLVLNTREGPKVLPIPIKSHDDIVRLNNDAVCLCVAACISELLEVFRVVELATRCSDQPGVLH